MGGSLARALRQLKDPPRVSGATRADATVRRALDDNAIDAGFPIAAPPEDADLLVYATPVGVTIEMLRSSAPFPDSMVVTDLGSVKGGVVRAAADLGLPRFVGVHPVAGDHRSGYSAARSDLYAGAQVWITPWPDSQAVDTTAPADAGLVRDLWSALGAKPAFIDATAHDELMAWVSHVPQVVSSALTAALARSPYPASLLGPGGRDTTRLGLSSSAMWSDILLQNAAHLTAPLEEVRNTLEQLSNAVGKRDAAAIEAIMTAAGSWRSAE
jgi:prephenate dehydrogenase